MKSATSKNKKSSKSPKQTKKVTKVVTKEELIAKAKKPGEDAMKLHPFYKGKIEIAPKCIIRNVDDFAIWYTPGVAQPCLDINKNPEKVFEHTNIGNLIAVVSDGTRVLGLGDIGPAAALPVMEGKALLFKYLGGVDAFPLCIGTKDPDKLIEFCKMLEPSVGGINLEDISQPKCFYILERLRKEMNIPVWHDDQQGTAAVTLAGLINALKLTGRKINETAVTMIGVGAANVCISKVIIAAGVDPKKMMMVDSKGILGRHRNDLKEEFKEKRELCQITNAEGRTGGIPEALKGADVCISLSKPGPDTIKKEWIAGMNKDAIVFVCANPIPEIWPWEAKEAGAKIVATGRSDFPNQVNNSLGFPGIFRGTLDVRARTITDEMCIAAAYELAKCAEDTGIHEDYLIPTMDEWEVYPRVATAVAMKAIEQGVARIKMSRKEIYETAEKIIKHARKEAQLLMKSGMIKKPPKT
ncbi:MAG: NADP-dependent malic enzyme [Thermoplasmata archaeon]